MSRTQRPTASIQAPRVNRSTPRWRHTTLLAVSAIVATSWLSGCGGGSETGISNQFYVQTNETVNKIVHFTRQADGSLKAAESTATGGAGSNGVKPGTAAAAPDSLVSQYSVIVSPDHTRLFTVNAGDNSISVLGINALTGVPTPLNTTKTTGTYPNSLAYANGVLYVSFLAGSNQVGAYRVNTDGSLTQIALYNPGQQTGLQNISPTQLVVDPSGSYLVVSAGTGANAVVSYPIKSDGSLGVPSSNALSTSNGINSFTPFAGTFVKQTSGPSVYLSTSIGDKALYSFSFNSAGALQPVSNASSGQTAPCWIVLTPSQKFAYVGNGAGSISSYAVGTNGQLSLLAADAIAGADEGVAGDTWMSPDGQYLYSTDLKNSAVLAYSVSTAGALSLIGKTPVSTTTGLSLQGAAGI